MALGVKGKRKERKDGGKDYPGQPETAHIHEIHSVTQNRVWANSSSLACRSSKSLKIGEKSATEN
jgi:hypothetical protein